MIERKYCKNYFANRAVETVFNFCNMNNIEYNVSSHLWKEFFAIKEAEHALEAIS